MDEIIKLAENLAAWELLLIQSKGIDKDAIRPTKTQCDMMNQIKKTKEQLKSKGAIVTDNGFNRTIVRFNGEVISVTHYVRPAPKKYTHFKF